MFAFLHGLVRGTNYPNDIRALDQRTLAAMLNRKYIRIDRNENIYLTNEGYSAYKEYTERDVPSRKRISELSALVDSLLQLRSNRISKANIKKVISDDQGVSAYIN